MNHTLMNKSALVVGASRRIGKAVAQRLAGSGARVAITYASQQKTAEDVVQSIEASGGQAIAFRADLSDHQETARLFDQVEVRFGGMDIFIASGSAPIVDKPLIDATEEYFDRVFALNVKGTFLALQEAPDASATTAE